jgi:uncharacterized membrane protein HdeD (DUF308 family)
MSSKVPASKRSNSNLLFGGILIAAGVLFLLGELFNIRLGAYAWPLLILVPGVLALGSALTVGESDAGVGLSIAGAIVTVLGTLLLLQNLTGLWATWAYAWALVAPTGVGLGMYLYGRRYPDRAQLRHDGRNVMRVGLVIFLAGLVFFELLLGISGLGIGSLAWGALFIGLGILLLVRSLWPRRSGAA